MASRQEELHALRTPVRQFAHALLHAMQTGEMPAARHARDFAWDLIEFKHEPDRMSHKLSCIALRMQELGSLVADGWSEAANALEVRLKTKPLDGGTDIKDDVAQVDTDGLVYPYPSGVRACRELAAEIDHIGLGILSLCTIRQEIYPVANLHRVEHPDKIRAVLPRLLGGNVRAMDHYFTLTKLMADSTASSIKASDGTDADPADQITNSTEIGV
jgi:hypothetical protein